MTTSTATHATDEHMAAITRSHGLTDALIVARIKSVDAAISDGVTVKTLSADMANAAARGLIVDGVAITAESQQTLGRARATVSALDRIGVTLASACKLNRATVADIYRAISRHGTKVTLTRIADAVNAGSEPDAKLERAGEIAAAMVAEAVAARKTRGAGEPGASDTPETSSAPRASEVRESDKDKRVATIVRAVAVLVTDIHNGGITLDADDIAELGGVADALISELQGLTEPAPVAELAAA